MDIIPCFPGRSIELKEMFTLEVKAGARCHGWILKTRLRSFVLG